MIWPFRKKNYVTHIGEPYSRAARCPACATGFQGWRFAGPVFRKGLLWLKCWSCGAEHTRLPAHPSAIEAVEPKRKIRRPR